MGRWPKPAEGSWTEHYPELGIGPIPFGPDAIFKRTWLNVGRIEELARVGTCDGG